MGAPHEAAKWASVPIINCGDGWGEHPTQVLTDLYTLWNMVGKVDGLTILAVGDHRMRTMHSIGYAASQFDVKLILIAPPDMAPTKEFLADLDQLNVQYRLAPDVRDEIQNADVIYMEPVVQADYTKSRVEANDGKGQTPPQYKVTRELMKDKARKDAIILHSLPRMDELPLDVDATRHARYWEEAFYGVAMKMGLLALILGAAE
jgi:aspartate carbamoyltransferase catalytic subunit